MTTRSKSTTFLLCYFLGVFGAHRFYLRRWPSAVLMLLTFGGLGIWMLVDAVLIAAGLLKDAGGEVPRSGPVDPQDPSAGFWVRAAAFQVDSAILYVCVGAVATGLSLLVPLLAVGAGQDLAALQDADPQALGLMLGAATFGLASLAGLLYFGVQTASRHRATIGKRCFGLEVSTLAGNRVGLGRALWRTLCYAASSLTLGIGYAIAGLTRDKRALHDFLASTRVVYAPGSIAAARTAQAFVHEPHQPALDRDAATPPRADLPAARPPAVVRGGGGGATVLMVLGALLLAAAAALALSF